MIHTLHAYSATLTQELSLFEYYSMGADAENTQDTEPAFAQQCADQFAQLLNESLHLDAADWQGRIKTQ